MEQKLSPMELIESLYKDLGFESEAKFRFFLVNDYYLFDDEEYELDNDEFCEKYKDVFVSELKQIKERLGIENDMTGCPLEEKIMTIIQIVKEINKDYLMKRFEGKIDAETADVLVQYSYTHGSCNSLSFTLCDMFPECRNVEVKVDNFFHQVVRVGEDYYDINGKSTKEQIKNLVAKEGKTTADCCTIKLTKPQSYRQKVFDCAVEKYLPTVTKIDDKSKISDSFDKHK